MPKTETPEEVRRWFQSAIQRLWPIAAESISLRKSPGFGINGGVEDGRVTPGFWCSRLAAAID